jgi:hypothetical protein
VAAVWQRSVVLQRSEDLNANKAIYAHRQFRDLPLQPERPNPLSCRQFAVIPEVRRIGKCGLNRNKCTAARFAQAAVTARGRWKKPVPMQWGDTLLFEQRRSKWR